MSDTNVGIILEKPQERDAIHVAIAAVEAAEKLKPGEHIGLLGNGGTAGKTDKPIGIVDPFLGGPVLPGQRFWMFLYPRTVTGMRHHWSHPDFPQELPNGDDKAESVKWLRAYAVRMNPYDPSEAAYERLIDGLKTGELFAHGSDLHGFYDVEDAENLRYHAERLLGIRIDWSQFTFTCSC